MSRILRAALLTAVLVTLAGRPGAAQSVDVTVNGTLTDQSGGVLPGATVVARSDATGTIWMAISDAEGRYVLRLLPAGIYDITAELDGFAPAIRQDHSLTVGTTATIDFQLALAGIAEQVIVKAAPAVREPTRHAVSRTILQDEIESLPVVNRNFNDLAALAAGATKTGVYGGVDIGGGRDFQNAQQVDGISAERQHLGDQRIHFAQDWIQEFQVLTGDYNVEFGQAAGGVINVITRSGGNDTAARAYGFARNGAWDATPAFAARKPPLEEYRTGGTVGGPLRSDRVFYFAGVDSANSQSSSIVTSTFESANGVFPATDTRLLWLAKIEGFMAPAHTFRLRYNGQQQRVRGSAVGGTSTEEHGRFTDLSAADLAGGWSWIASSSTSNELRAAWSTVEPEGGCNLASRAPQGTWFERSYPGAQFGCPVNFGTIAEDQLQLVDNVWWRRGRHAVKVGAHATWTRSRGEFRNFRDGRYIFDRDIPFHADSPESHPFAFVMIEGPTSWDVPGWSMGMFAQDEWRLSDDFTLHAGLRYDVDGSLTALNGLVRIDKGMHRIDGDLDNIAPRGGFAWTPFANGRRTLVRGGGGLYFDQNHNNVAVTLLLNNVLVDRVITVNANNPLLNPFWPDVAAARAFLADALARTTTPDLSALGTVAGSTNDIDPALQVPFNRRGSLGLVHQFNGWFDVSADLVYSRGIDLYVLRNTNLDPVTFGRLNPNYTSILSFGNGGESRHTALQLQAHLNGGAARALKVAYTLADSRANTDTTLSGGGATNPFDYSEDEGPTDYDVRHNLTLNGSILVPFGLQVSGMASYRSALPYSARTSAPRPDGKPFGFRPEPRNARRGDSAFSLDVRVAKAIALGTGRSASVFLETFNLTNAVNYSHYVGIVTSSRFTQPTQAGPMRRMQLGFRVDF